MSSSASLTCDQCGRTEDYKIATRGDRNRWWRLTQEHHTWPPKLPRTDLCSLPCVIAYATAQAARHEPGGMA